MSRADALIGQFSYVPLIATAALDGSRLSFGGGETIADFKTPQAAFAAQREAEKATAAILARLFQ